MTKQHLLRGAPPRVVEGSSTLSKDVGGRWPAPHVTIWLPVAFKLLAAVLAAIVLAIVGARAGAYVPVTEPRGDHHLPPMPAAAPRPADPMDAAGGAPPSFDGGIERGPAILPDGRVILNLATEEELTRLPGIGPSRARAILTLRQRLTRFRAVEDLLRVKGIGRKTLRRLRPSVVLDRPPADPHSEPATIPRPAEPRSTGP